MALIFASLSGNTTPIPGIVCDEVVAPPAIRANQNDYAPLGYDSANQFEFDGGS